MELTVDAINTVTNGNGEGNGCTAINGSVINETTEMVRPKPKEREECDTKRMPTAKIT